MLEGSKLPDEVPDKVKSKIPRVPSSPFFSPSELKKAKRDHEEGTGVIHQIRKPSALRRAVCRLREAGRLRTCVSGQ